MSTLRYWVLDTQHGHRFYLDWATGERLQTILDARVQYAEDRPKEPEPMFLSLEDVTGATVVIRVDGIGELWCSTPAIRELENDPDGVFEGIRALARAQSRKKWAADPDEEEEE